MKRHILITETQYRNFIRANSLLESQNNISDSIDKVAYISYDSSSSMYSYANYWDDVYVYNIKCFDINDNLILDRENVRFKELEGLLGRHIVSMIEINAENGNTSGVFTNIIKNRPKDINNVEELNDKLKSLFSVEEYKRNSSGFILTDGTFINLGQVLHQDLGLHIPGLSIDRFLQLGAIRISDRGYQNECGINVFKIPTAEQKSALYKPLGLAARVALHVKSNSGESFAIFHNPEPKIIINQITRFFNEGIQLKENKSRKDRKLIATLPFKAISKYL